MSEPFFFRVNEEVTGAVIDAPGGGFRLSAFHAPSGREIYGIEHSAEAVVGWMEGAKLVLCEAEGKA